MITPAPRTHPAFARRLLDWYDRHGRKDLPWQQPRDAYRVWLSEVMLQQTQVATVIPYFERFVAALPNLPALAAASEDRVLALWSGLGYYTRARNLRRAARICMEQHAGALPRDAHALAALPGIGRSTAAAILALAWDEPHAILDGNVRRVLARWHGVTGWPGASAVQARLWQLAQAHLPRVRAADYTQAIMDLGATVCVRAQPRCAACPVARGCTARRDGTIAQLPQARPARTKPRRACVVLLVRDAGGAILLQRRPASGVWARLWSLPQAPSAAAARALLRQWQLGGVRPRALAPIEHGFTHYHLRITPLLCEVERPTCVADSPDSGWYTPPRIARLGLPAPIRRLIQTLEPP